jgi:hypothetical protein
MCSLQSQALLQVQRYVALINYINAPYRDASFHFGIIHRLLLPAFHTERVMKESPRVLCQIEDAWLKLQSETNIRTQRGAFKSSFANYMALGVSSNINPLVLSVSKCNLQH